MEQGMHGQVIGELTGMQIKNALGRALVKEIPSLVNRLPAKGVVVLKDGTGAPLDGTDVAKVYLDSLPGKNLTQGRLQLDRIRLVKPLPGAQHSIGELQPLGAPAR